MNCNKICQTDVFIIYKLKKNAFTIIQNEISNKNANVQQNNDTIFIQ